MARKKDWSLIDAQMEMRDTQDRQGRFHSPAFEVRDKVDPGYLYDGPPIMRHLTFGERMPSPDRLRERSDTRDPNFAMNRQDYNRMTYSQTDVADLRGAKSGLAPDAGRAEQQVDRPEYRGGFHPTNFGLRGQGVNNPASQGGMVRSARQSIPETPKQSGYRRQRSTQEAYRAADTSMFDSTVTPKAEPLKDYKPRGKVFKEPETNIQAFY